MGRCDRNRGDTGRLPLRGADLKKGICRELNHLRDGKLKESGSAHVVRKCTPVAPTELTTTKVVLVTEDVTETPGRLQPARGSNKRTFRPFLLFPRVNSERVRSCLVAIRNRGSARLGVRIT